MDETDSLLTIAELALGIAGFSGVMTAFMQRPGKLTIVETYRIGVLLGASFGAMFLAFAPLALAQLGLAGTSAWRSASLLMITYAIIAGAIYIVASRRINRAAPEIFNPWVFASLVLGHLANVALQAVNAFGAGAAGAGLYIIGLLWFLLHAAIQFARILFIQPASRAGDRL